MQIFYTQGVSVWLYAKMIGAGLCAAKVMAGTHLSTKFCNTRETESHQSTFTRWDTRTLQTLLPDL